MQSPHIEFTKLNKELYVIKYKDAIESLSTILTESRNVHLHSS